MKSLRFGLVASLGFSACTVSTYSPEESSQDSTNSSAESSATTTTEGKSGDESEKPTTRDGGAKPTKPADDAAVSTPADGDGGDVPPPPEGDASVVTPPETTGGQDTETGLPPLPPPCGGLCDDGQLCNLATDECVECLTDADCSEGNECRANACEAIIACENSEGCPENLAVCHSQLDRCVECEIDLDCPEAHSCEGRACVEAAPTDQCAMGDDPCGSGTVLPMKETQVLDARGDEFCEIPGFELNFGNAARGNADLPQTMTMRVAWSEDAFHLYAEVTDPEVVTNAEIDYLWSGDVVELYLAPGPASGLSGYFSGRIDGVQLLIAPPTNAQPARAARLFWMPNQDGNQVQVREEMTSGFAARATQTGYAVEARLPWSMFGPRTPDIENGISIALDVGLSTASAATIGNANDGREGAIVLFAGPTGEVNTCSGDQVPWCNSTSWCTTTLRDKAPPAPIPDDAGVK